MSPDNIADLQARDIRNIAMRPPSRPPTLVCHRLLNECRRHCDPVYMGELSAGMFE